MLEEARRRIHFMESDQTVKPTKLVLRGPWWIVLLAMAAGWAEAATNVVVWDTGSRLPDTVNVENREGWKAVPSELFVFEAEPAKASSDPGYYGREYSFKGDVVVENRSLAAFFLSAKGTVAIYSKADSPATAASGT